MIFKIESPLILKIYSNELHHTVTKAAKKSIITLLVKKVLVKNDYSTIKAYDVVNPLIIKEGEQTYLGKFSFS